MEHKLTNTDSPRASELVSCVIRFHDPGQLNELSLALMGLAGQTYEWVEPILVLQEFSGSEEDAVRSLVSRIPWPETFSSPKILNIRGLGKGDHRAHLANAGIEARSGRFLCFLDYDDQVYGSCYETLHDRLVNSGKAVACVGVVACDVEMTHFGAYVLNKRRIFDDRDKYEIFLENQYPIHSFMIDTGQVDSRLLSFDEGQAKNEDYAFLLRILAQRDWDLGAIGKPLVEYRMRVDGSNTILSHSEGDTEKWDAWLRAIKYIDGVKDDLTVTLPCSELIALASKARDAAPESAPPTPSSSDQEKLISYLGALAHRISWSDLEPTPFGNVDQLTMLDRDTCLVAGWMAAPDKSPVDFVIIRDLRGEGSGVALCGLCDVFRDDVRKHLESRDGNFGFHIQVRKHRGLPSKPGLIGVMANGRMYRLDAKPHRGAKHPGRGLWRKAR